MRLVQVFDDRQRLGDRRAVVYERGDESLWVDGEEFRSAVCRSRGPQVDVGGLVGDTLEVEGDTRSKCRGATEVSVELHRWCQKLDSRCRAPRQIGVSGCGHDGIAQILQPLDAAFDPVAVLERANARRGAGEDEIAGLELEQGRQLRDHLRYGPDQFSDVRVLAQLPVHGQPDSAFRYMSTRRGS